MKFGPDGPNDQIVYKPDQVRQEYLRDAIDTILEGRDVPLEETEPWRLHGQMEMKSLAH